ncbi:MAG: acetamidase/formamidase family protein [Hyphomicrobiaceae bacterium]
MAQRIDAGPQTVHWGFFDAALAPVVSIESGETVTLTTVSGTHDTLPDPPLVVPQALQDIQATVSQELPGHICTGPVAVRGARPGNVLEVRIRSIELLYEWGYTRIRPLHGALPDDFPTPHMIHSVLDRSQMTATLPWGQKLKLSPFFGVMAVAPPAAWGKISTLPPRRNGGNLDNKELVAGSTLYLPIHVSDALFSIGDGHGVQGDGEVCVTAIETGLVGELQLIVRHDLKLEWPQAETPSHVITMAFDPDLDSAVVIALRQMVDLIASRTGLSRENAYMLSSLVADVRVTQVVNGNKGIHVMLAKAHLAHASQQASAY